LREVLRETEARGRERVDVRARLARVPVGAEAVGAQGVDQDEEHVEVVTRR